MQVCLGKICVFACGKFYVINEKLFERVDICSVTVDGIRSIPLMQ